MAMSLKQISEIFSATFSYLEWRVRLVGLWFKEVNAMKAARDTELRATAK